jgi:hypothetical protein
MDIHIGLQMSEMKSPHQSQSHIDPKHPSPRPESQPTPPPPSLVLPTLYCPFPTLLNPHADAADAHTLQWVQHHRLFTNATRYKHVAALHPGWLAARTTPHADPHRLQLVTDWCSWFFIHDDYCDEGGIGRNPQAMRDLHARFRAVLNGDLPDEADIPLTTALHELWHRTLPLVADAWQQGFIANMDDFFEAGVWEATNRSKGEIPPLADYLRMRPFTGGMFAYLDLIEMSESLLLPQAVRTHPMVHPLLTMTANIVSWANDVLSLPKELKQGDIHNIVFSMQQSQQLTVQEALDRAAHLHNSEIERFIQVEAALPSFTDSENELLQRYTLTLRTLIRGSLDWLSTSVRYQVTDN